MINFKEEVEKRKEQLIQDIETLCAIPSVYNEKTKQYLVNTGANNFFTTTSGNMKIAATTGSNPATLRICQENGKRYVLFYETQMNFNATGDYPTTGSTEGYELVLMEKQDQEL